MTENVHIMSFWFNEIQCPSATFRISGPDANTYLSGQFTQEIRGGAGRCSYGLWLTQKGKVLGDSHILKLAENDYLVFAGSLTSEALRQRLEDYLIADEVTLEDESAQWCSFSLGGAAVEDAVLRLAGGEVAPASARQVEGAWLARAWGRERGWWCLWMRRDARERWLSRLAEAGAVAVGEAEVARARILAGIPAVPVDIGPDDLPNEGGLDETAISYTKGCYLGQEVMARLKNLGQVRRRLHVVRGAGQLPASRTALVQGERRVGEVRSVAAAGGDGEFVAFAMLSLVNFDPAAPLRLDGRGDAVEVVPHG